MFPTVEDSYNGEGSSQANKTSKKQATGNFFNFLSFKKKKSCNKLVKLHFYYSTQTYDSITRYLIKCMGNFQKVFLMSETFLVYKLETFKNC